VVIAAGENARVDSFYFRLAGTRTTVQEFIPRDDEWAFAHHCS
jgi:hypothetical protein